MTSSESSRHRTQFELPARPGPARRGAALKLPPEIDVLLIFVILDIRSSIEPEGSGDHIEYGLWEQALNVSAHPQMRKLVPLELKSRLRLSERQMRSDRGPPWEQARCRSAPEPGLHSAPDRVSRS